MASGDVNPETKNEDYIVEEAHFKHNEDGESSMPLYIQEEHTQNLASSKHPLHIARSNSQPLVSGSEFFQTQLKIPELELFNIKSNKSDFVGPSNEKPGFRALFTAQKHEMQLNAAEKSPGKHPINQSENKKSPHQSPTHARGESLEAANECKINRDDREYRAALNFKRIRGDITNKRNYIIREKGETRPMSLEQIKRNEMKMEEKLDMIKQFNRAKADEFEQFNFGATRTFEKANNSLKRRLIMRIQSEHHLQQKERVAFLKPSEKNSFTELRKATASLKNEKEVFMDLAQKFAQSHTPSAKQLKSLLNLSLKSQTPHYFYSKNNSIEADSMSPINNSTAQSSAIKARLLIQSQPSSPVNRRDMTGDKGSAKPLSPNRGISSALTNKRSTATSWKNMSATSSLWATTTHRSVKERIQAQKANSFRDFRTYLALTQKKHVPPLHTTQLKLEVTNFKKPF